MLSWLLTNQPSNLRIRHCNRMVQTWCPQGHTHLPVDRGNPFHEPCSTTPFSAHSIQPANSRTHQHNCMGPLGRVASLASLVAGLAALVARSVEVAAQWEGTRDGGLCNTTLFLSAAQVFSASTAQLNGSTGPEGTG